MRLTGRKMWCLLYQYYEYAMYIYIPLFYMHTHTHIRMYIYMPTYIQTHVLFSSVTPHSDCFVNSDVTKKNRGGYRDLLCTGKSVVITQHPLE